MNRTNAAALSEPGSPGAITAALCDEGLACNVVDLEQHRRRAWWKQFAEETLRHWEDPVPRSELVAAGLEPPTQGALRTAHQLALRMAEEEMELPTRAAPDGDGGFVLEIDREPYFATLHVEEGRVLFAAYSDCKPVQHCVFEIAGAD